MKATFLGKKIKITLALIIVAFMAFGWLFAPNDPIKQNLTKRLSSPFAEYPLGTDSLGRCELSRLLYGGQTTLAIIALGCLGVLFVGLLLGLFHGYYKGRFSPLLDSILNMFTAFPPIIYAIILVGSWGGGITAMVISIIMACWAILAKLVKTNTEEEKHKAYVLCAIASGASWTRILFRHILPNIIGEASKFLAMTCADMILLVTGLSFIGVRLGNDVIDWGSMVADGRVQMDQHPLLVWGPAFGIILTTLAMYLFSEAFKKRGDE